MNLSRRHFLFGGVGLVLGGCADPANTLLTRPGAPWPAYGQRPRNLAGVRGPTLPEAPPASPASLVAAGPLRAMPRSRWANRSPIASRLTNMGHINRITVHHEGWSPIFFDDVTRTAARLESIRKSHLARMRAGDIGYHFIIDRRGRLWEGRELRFQGAHAGGINNQHNIGVMVLGNFDEQSPTEHQYAALHETLLSLARHHQVAANRVYTHQELAPTACPGVVLQGHMDRVVRRRVLI